jgi:hypothetical protein
MLLSSSSVEPALLKKKASRTIAECPRCCSSGASGKSTPIPASLPRVCLDFLLSPAIFHLPSQPQQRGVSPQGQTSPLEAEDCGVTSVSRDPTPRGAIDGGHPKVKFSARNPHKPGPLPSCEPAHPGTHVLSQSADPREPDAPQS